MQLSCWFFECQASLQTTQLHKQRIFFFILSLYFLISLSFFFMYSRMEYQILSGNGWGQSTLDFGFFSSTFLKLKPKHPETWRYMVALCLLTRASTQTIRRFIIPAWYFSGVEEFIHFFFFVYFLLFRLDYRFMGSRFGRPIMVP